MINVARFPASRHESWTSKKTSTALNRTIWPAKDFWSPKREITRLVQRFNRFSGTVLLKPRVVHIHVLRFRPKKVDFHVAIANIINRWCLASRIFEEERSDDASSPKSSPTSDAFLNDRSWIFSTPNETIFSIYQDEDNFARKTFVIFKYRSKRVALHF